MSVHFSFVWMGTIDFTAGVAIGGNNYGAAFGGEGYAHLLRTQVIYYIDLA